MRNFLFSIALLLSVPLLSSAQSPVYLMYTTDCVDQLEYRAAYGSSTWLVYSLRPSADAQFLLKAGDSGIRSKNKPQGARTCREFVINDAFADVVNKGERPVYMVHQDADGFMLMPLVACTQVTRYGSVYQFRAPRFAFAVDTNNLVNEQNIAAPNSNAYIYFNGIRFRNCRNEYSFRRVPTGANQEQSDLDFIPGVGLTSDKTGKSASEAEGNLYRLTKVNGVALDDYISRMCKSQPQTTPPPSTVSKWTSETNYGPTSPTSPDKETASLPPVGPPPPPAAPSRLPVECTEVPGYGYHLVMPGESLNAISRSYRVTVKDLIKWNKIKNANHLEVCQKVWLMQPPAGANMVSKRKDAVQPPAPVQHNAKVVEKYDGPTIVRQDVYWSQPATQQPQQYSTGKSPNYWEQPTTGNYISPVVYSNTGSTPSTASPTVVQPPTAFMHTVKPRETVSGLARYYGITEECLRHQNNMPLTGDVTIYVDQQLRIALCQPGTIPSAVQQYNTPTYTPPQQYNTNPSAPYTAPNPNYDVANDPNYKYNPYTGLYEYNPRGNDANYKYNPQTGLYDYIEPKQNNRPGAFLEGPGAAPQPNQYNTGKPNTTAEPNTNPDIFDENQPINGGGAPNFTTKGNTSAGAQYFGEHVVKQGENLRAIAIIYNISTAELAQLNSISETESLMPGKRLVVPRK